MSVDLRLLSKTNPHRKVSDKSTTCTKKFLPLSVKTLHLDVCIFEITDPSSIFRKLVRLVPCRSFSELGSTETSSAKAGLEFMHRITDAEKEEN